MFVSKKKFDRLEERVKELERQITLLRANTEIAIPKFSSSMFMALYPPEFSEDRISVSVAVKMLAKHMGLKFAHTAGTPAKFEVKPLDTIKIKTTKK